MFGMANLRPEHTGLDLLTHVYKDEDRRVRHGPRIKVYPGKYHQGRPTVISIPAGSRGTPELESRLTISGRDFNKAVAFIRRNHAVLVRYWYDMDFGEDELREELQP